VGVEGCLKGLGLQLSAARVAGCFMFTDLDALWQRLDAAEHQLQSIARQRCHHGIADQLLDTQVMLHTLMEAVKVG